MKTEDLIGLLARHAGPAPRGLVRGRIGRALALGLVAGLALVFVWLGFIPAETYTHAAPWFKFAYSAALAASTVWLTLGMARPGANTAAASAATVGVLLGALLLGLLSWQTAPSQARVESLLGHSWWVCPWSVLALSLPSLAALMWALRGLAPTRLRAAGFAAGLLAGAVGAGAYALACDELALSFVAVWYTLGMLMTAGLGALLGPHVLRW